jgi:hypothetical protein
MPLLYTKKDYFSLHGRIDIHTHNIKDWTIPIKNKKRLGYQEPSEDPEDIIRALKRLVSYLAPQGQEEFYVKIALEYPLEELLLLMNKNKNIDLIIQWRIDINK